MTKTWIKSLFTFALVLCAGLAYAAEPWAMWSNFSGLTGAKSPDISSTQNEINGASFTFNLGSGVVNNDGSLTTTGGASTEAPYIDFNRGDINVGYNHNPVTVVAMIEMPETLPTDDNGSIIVKPLWTVGDSDNNGIGLTLNGLSDEAGATFGGAWQNAAWNSTDATKQFTIASIKPGQAITFVATSPSSNYLVNSFGGDSLSAASFTSLGSIPGLAGREIPATRITFGNFHHTFDNKTTTFIIRKVAIFWGTEISVDDVLASFPEAVTGVSTRTLDAAEESWDNTEKWSGGAVPGEDSSVLLTAAAEENSTVTLDQAVDVAELWIDGDGSVAFSGAGLTAGVTRINADVDVSNISASLGDVTVSSGSKLTVLQTNAFSSIVRNASSVLKITGDIDYLPLADNAVLETSGNVVLSDGITETLKGRSWVLSGGESSAAYFYLASGTDWGNSGNKSYLTMRDGAKLTITGDASVIGRTTTDGAMMFAECGNGSGVFISGSGTELKIPNGALNLSRDGATTATVSDGALLQAYKLGGTSNASTLTITNATLVLGKEGADDGVVKMTSCKLVLQDATLAAAGDWAVATDSTASQIEVKNSLTLDLNDKNVILRNMTFTKGSQLAVEGTGTLALDTFRPTISALSDVQKITLKMTLSEQGLGEITFNTSLTEAPSKDLFEVFKADGTTAATWVETDPVTIADGVLKLKFVALEPILADGSLSDSVSEDSAGDLLVDGGTEGITLTIDMTLPDTVNLIVSGKVTLKTSGSATLPLDRMSVLSGAEIGLETAPTEDFTVPANSTFILVGGTDAENQKTFGTYTVPANATLKTKGHLAVTLASNNGTFDVLDGVATVTAGAGQAIKGTVYVRRGAEFVNITNDAVAYNGATIIHVYGVLNMNTSRWTVGGSSILHLYAGCEVKGTGDGDGIIDFFRSGAVVQVHLDSEVESATTAVVSGVVRNRNNEAQIQIDSGAYVNFSGGLWHATTEGQKILTRTGAGGFIGTNYLKGVILDLGKHANVEGRFVAASGENTLKVNGLDAGNVSFCSNDSKDDPVIKVESGSTLTLAIRDYSGWNGNVTEHGWIVNNGTLKLAAKDTGSRFFREHIVIGDGATTIVEQNASDSSTERAQILYGGAPSEELAQIQLPTGTATISTNGTAAAKVLYLGNDGTGGYGTKGAGISVGKGAELTLEPTIKGPDGITKWGDGDLKFVGPMDEYTGTLTLNGGTISIAPGCGFTGSVVTAVEKKAVALKTESDGTVVYRLTADYFYIRIR